MHSDGTPEEPVEKCEDCNNLIAHKDEHHYLCKYSDATPPWAEAPTVNI